MSYSDKVKHRRDSYRNKMQNPFNGTLACISFIILGILASTAHATWSIVLIDTRTREIAIGSATCLTNFDLQRASPVVVVGVGAAAAQAMVDSGAKNRQLIQQKFYLGWDPVDILAELEQQDPYHQSRQYGIVDTTGRVLTFTGSSTYSWSGGVTGQIGTVFYAIQGNILTGEPVILEAEQAILNTPGDLAEKLMAGMEAAREMGGDGRCSCTDGAPEDCGSPPPVFDKAAHIGYMIFTRPGDIDGTCSSSEGCANGDYFMSFNVAYQQKSDPDPVYQLRDMFDAWRIDLIGRPDAVQSVVTIDQPVLPPDGESLAVMNIELKDWQGNPITQAISSITVVRDESSDRVTTIGDINDLGNGKYQVNLTARMYEGTDHYSITVDDGIRPVLLLPIPEVKVEVPAGSYKLLDPVPGYSKQVNDFCIENGQVGANVFLLYSLSRGIKNTPCGYVELNNPVIAGKMVVNADGRACLSRFVSGGAHMQTVFMQAIHNPGCLRSNAVKWLFKNN